MTWESHDQWLACLIHHNKHRWLLSLTPYKRLLDLYFELPFLARRVKRVYRVAVMGGCILSRTEEICSIIAVFKAQDPLFGAQISFFTALLGADCDQGIAPSAVVCGHDILLP